MGINWKVRIRNKSFWLAIVPAILLLVQSVGTPFGFRWDFGVLNDQLKAIIENVFTVLVIIGIVNDPTTATLADSIQALSYDQPKAKGDATIDASFIAKVVSQDANDRADVATIRDICNVEDKTWVQ